MKDIYAASELRKKYPYFRILVIGRANAGKTTILKRVCNTTEDPHFYDEETKTLLEPTSTRGIHDINRPFVFKSNPEFIFHDSPGFEAGDKRQLEEVQGFIKKRATSRRPEDQLHAIWLLLLLTCDSLINLLPRFCFIPDISRFLLDLEKRFFNEERAGNVPVIAIFTKFDDLISQVYNYELSENDNRKVAEHKLNSLKAPLFNDYHFPPKDSLCFEDMHDDEGEHQQYVKKLIKITAESLDNLELKKLFVSVQKNNLELCIEYAVLYGGISFKSMNMHEFVHQTLEWFGHANDKVGNLSLAYKVKNCNDM